MRLPDWVKIKSSASIHDTKRILRHYRLSTVCEEARCPNIGECYSKPTATFMILGSKCTRNCGFCSVESSVPERIDHEEPERIALAANEMGLSYLVITSVTRDDLPDGGAEHFAETVCMVRKHLPHTKVEVLVPDFKGSINSIVKVLQSRPDVFGHNVETVPRLYPMVRPRADYMRSLDVLRHTKRIAPEIHTKSGLMVGLGEKFNEVVEVLEDLREEGCDFVTIGQYLRPSKTSLPVVEYVRPETFERLRLIAMDMGFSYVASSPLVRSSLHAESALDFKGQEWARHV